MHLSNIFLGGGGGLLFFCGGGTTAGIYLSLHDLRPRTYQMFSWWGGGLGGYCFSVGVVRQRGSIYLFMISDPLSSVIEIKDLGIRQPNQLLEQEFDGQDLRCFS